MVHIEVQLARPTVRLGGTIVGTIRCTAAAPNDNVPLRAHLASLHLSAVGLCRLDPRWHNTSMRATTGATNAAALLPPMDVHTTPFWTTEPLEVLSLPERTYGRWRDVQPRAIQLFERDHDATTTKPMDQSTTRNNAPSDNHMTDEHQLAFTFAISIPSDAPHSLIATSCKYYYLIVLRLMTTDAAPEWIQCPVTVLTAPPHNDASILASTATSNPVHATAHSFGLPTHVTATELHTWQGQYTVCSAHSLHSETVQSMRVDDPVSGRPICVLSLLGTSPAHLVPGSRLILKLDFPTIRNDWMPCAAASACLQGEECVVPSSQRARRYLFGTAHERVDANTTESVSLVLVLDDMAPCSIVTSQVQLEVRCVLDLALQDQTKFRNVRLDIPCRVSHGLAEWERVDTSGEAHVPALDDVSSPATPALARDLQLVSLQMATVCGLGPPRAATAGT